MTDLAVNLKQLRKHTKPVATVLAFRLGIGLAIDVLQTRVNELALVEKSPASDASIALLQGLITDFQLALYLTQKETLK